MISDSVSSYLIAMLLFYHNMEAILSEDQAHLIFQDAA